MSQPIGMTGLARITTGAAASVGFLATQTASTSKTVSLNPLTKYAVFLSVAGNTLISVQASSDSPDTVDPGTSVKAAAKSFAATSADGYLGTVTGASSVMVTQAKSGSTADDANKITALGGNRAVVRFVEVPAAWAGDTGLGAYTALTLAS